MVPQLLTGIAIVLALVGGYWIGSGLAMRGEAEPSLQVIAPDGATAGDRASARKPRAEAPRGEGADATDPARRVATESRDRRPGPTTRIRLGVEPEMGAGAGEALAGGRSAGAATRVGGGADIAAPVEDLAPGAAHYQPTGADTDAEGLRAAEAGRIGRPTLVFFHADSCHVCQEITPELEQLSEAHAEEVALVKMNIDHDASGEAVRRYGVAATPTFVLLSAGGEQMEYLRGWPGGGQMAEMLARGGQ